ncbi:Faa [Desulfamplus magnetovallimortis]|uniref:histidine kinase n=1 Tax=Desulfamplus magnetovallimortis TaxID=1246637 RepID=A0A1W1HHF6_9BACT|nr:7TM diverse intracellular signaling domain-containing protein [Desulfamplus magnetovallimortis]SLM31812.1 Faa [Desulfamplus magnetovallimortis]
MVKSRTTKCRLLISILLILVPILWNNGKTHADPLSLLISSVSKNKDITKYIEYYIDKSGTMDIDTIVSEKINPLFSPLEKSSFGYSQSSFWFRFKVNGHGWRSATPDHENNVSISTVKNPEKNTIEWFLEYPYAVVDQFDFYQIEHSSQLSKENEQLKGKSEKLNFQLMQSGDKYPFSRRPVNYRTTVIPISSAPGVETFYINIRSGGSIMIPLLAWEKNAMLHHINMDSVINWLYYGIMLATVIFNSFIFFSVREKVYLYLIIFVSGTALFTMTHSGLSFQYLWPESTWWANICHPFFGFAGFTGAILFTMSFLSTAKHLPRFNVCLKMICYAGFAMLPVPFLFSYRIATQSMVIFIGISVMIMLANGLILFYRGDRPARFYILAWSPMLFSSILMVLKSYGFLENNILTDSGVQISNALLVIIFTFALVDKINIIREEKSSALTQLKESENKYRMLAQNIKEVIWTLDLKTLKINFITPSIEAMTGYTPEEAKNEFTFEKMLPPDSAKKAMNAVKKGMASTPLNIDDDSELKSYRNPGDDSSTITVEVEFNTKKGTVIWTETTLTIIKDSNNKPVEMLGVTRETTERKLAEDEKQHIAEKLMNSNKMQAIGTLAGGIAHDMNNILTAIMGYVEICRSEVSSDSKIYKRLQRVINACYRARDLVSQILTFSRQDKQETIPLNINPMVKEVLKLIRASLPTTIKIHQSIPREKYVIMADPTKIHQILMNLCTNAAYAMMNDNHETTNSKNISESCKERSKTGKEQLKINQPKTGILALSTEVMELDIESAEKYLNLSPGTYIRLTVSDTGHGMDKKTMDRIFEPFFTTKPRGKGTGMGLAMVHGIVKGLKGNIYVYSEVGKGTTFHLLFPKAPDKTDIECTATSICMSKGDETILYVDDESDIVEMASEMLRSLGYNVICHTDSQQALECVMERPGKFDLMITDQTMPGMTGCELAHKIWEIRPDMPVILCTGFNELVTPESAIQMGISRYVMKPYSKQDLSVKIREVLEQSST